MPKPATFPDLFNDALQIHISKLKEWGYLKYKIIVSNTIRWSRNGNERGSISFYLNSDCTRPYIELDYKYRDEPRKYRIYFVTKPSNLGKGEVWFFICPKTGKLCRKLYSIGGYFLHRDAFTGCMYESQTQSKKWRDIDKVYGSYFKSEQLCEQLYKKHLKKTYAGKPTKKYSKLTAEIAKADSFAAHDIERLLLI